jgi:hypothetical protein
MKKNPMGYILLFAGLFSYLSAYHKWSIYYKIGTTKWWIKMIGEKNTRIFSMVAGVVFALIGLLGVMGVIELPQKRM